MNLRNLFPAREAPPPPELFLAVEIHESLIKTAVWQRQGEEVSINSIGSFESWDSEDSLVNGIDSSLTAATKEIDPPPDKVIFGLPDSWLEKDGKIHASKTNLIKRLLKDLGLKPLGLLTTSQAIVQQIKSEEGIPPTAILLEVYLSKVVVSVIRLGQIEASEEVGRSGDISKDVEEALVRINSDKLPARFILTNGSNLDDEQQQITAYPWTEKLPFIHLPKVEVLPIDFSIKAIALIGGQEASKLSQENEASLATPTPEITPVSLPEEKPVASSLADLGFSVESESASPVTEESSLTEVGNTITFSPHAATTPIPEAEEVESNIESVSTDFSTPEEPVAPPIIHPPVMSQPPAPKVQLKFALPSFALPKLNIALPRLPKFKAIFYIIPPLAILLLVTLGYFFFAKADIEIVVSPSTMEQSLDVSVDGDKKVLTASVTDSLATSGEALVGEKATGKVTVYNRSYQTISLKAGAKLTINNLEFVLDDAVKIASAAADPNPPFTTTPGSASSLSVTATKIGAESNLPKTTQFTVDNQAKSVMIAVADSDFAGGTSRTVKAATKADQDKLIAQATEKIKADINNQVGSQNPDLVTVPLKEISLTKKEFDKNIGEEATTISLSATGETEVLIYSKSNLQSKVSSLLMGQIPSDKSLVADKLEINLTEPSLVNGTYTSKSAVKALLVPKVDTEALAKQSAGKTQDQLRTLYGSITGYQKTHLTIYPFNVPLLSNYLPLNSSRLNLSIVTP